MTYLLDQKPPLDEALVHFGVKGMRWGVRKASRQAQESGYTPDDLDKFDFDDEPKSNRKLKVAAGAAAVIVGAVVVTAILNKHGKVPVSALKGVPANATRATADDIRRFKVGDAMKAKQYASYVTKESTGKELVRMTSQGAKKVYDLGPEFWSKPVG